MTSPEEIERHAAEVIKAWRKERGLSQAELARQLGTHQSAIAKMEIGDRRIDFATMVQIADLLQIPWIELKADPRDSPARLLEALSSYLVEINTLFSTMRSHALIAEHDVQSSSNLIEKLEQVEDEDKFPEEINIQAIYGGISRVSGLKRKFAPASVDFLELDAALEPLRQLRRVLDGRFGENAPISSLGEPDNGTS